MKKYYIHEKKIESLQRQLAELSEIMSVKRSQEDVILASIEYFDINKSVWEYRLKEYRHDVWVENN